MVRMWSENANRVGVEWRGEIREIESGRKLYVTGPGEVADFIAALLSAQGERIDRDDDREVQR